MPTRTMNARTDAAAVILRNPRFALAARDRSTCSGGASHGEGRDRMLAGSTSAETRQNKKDQLTLAQCGISALGPAPTIPGGWGLRNPKPKEPDQRSVFFSQVREAGG